MQGTSSRKITADTLPKGPHWDEDDACFVAEVCNPADFGCDWRWVPRNWKAFGKGEPDKPLYDFVLPKKRTIYTVPANRALK